MADRAGLGGESVPGRTALTGLSQLEVPWAQDFGDPKLEWRRLFSEVLGTFFLVLVGAGGAVVGAQSHGAIARSAAVTAPGLIVLAIILFMGAVSGAHLNPAVSIAFATRGDFPWLRVPGYIIMQLLGSTLACLFLAALFGKIGMLGATEPGSGVSDWQAMSMELVLTVGLVSTILGTASGAQNVGPIAALGVGGYIVLAGLWSSPISGASMNPARSFGPDLVLANFSHYWVYLVGPIVGGLIAVAFAYVLRGRGGDESAKRAAMGTLESLPQGQARQCLVYPDASVIPAILPGFLAAGTAALVYTGIDNWPGVYENPLSLGTLPNYPTVRLADVAWCILVALSDKRHRPRARVGTPALTSPSLLVGRVRPRDPMERLCVAAASHLVRSADGDCPCFNFVPRGRRPSRAILFTRGGAHAMRQSTNRASTAQAAAPRRLGGEGPRGGGRGGCLIHPHQEDAVIR